MLELLSRVKKVEGFRSKYFDTQAAHRYLFRLSDGSLVEAGLYQHFSHGIPQGAAIDVSTMVGCPMKCKFCASGALPYRRALSPREMVAQVSTIVEEHDLAPFPKLTCAFQGIGEPSLIPQSIIRACEDVRDRHPRFVISISTTGAQLKALRSWRRARLPIDNLQFSLHGTTTRQIRRLVPRFPSLGGVLAEIRACAACPTIKRVRLNYIAVAGLNDRDEDIARLAGRFAHSNVALRIATLNVTCATRRFSLEPSSAERTSQMEEELRARGVDCFVFGPPVPTTISCGQLAFMDTGLSHEV